MSDPVTAFRHKPYAAFLAAGIASSLLYTSIFLSFAFLLPIQIAFGRSGRSAGLAAAGIAAAGIAVLQGWRLAAVGAFGSLALAAGTLSPIVLLGALALVNAPFWGGWAAPYKVFSVTAACAIAAFPLLISLGRDLSFTAYLEGRIGAFLAPLRSASGDGYEASALAAALDPKELVETSIATLRNSYAAILLFIIGGSRRLGNRLSGPGSRGREETAAIDELRLPYLLLWAFLASWSLVLAAVLLRAPQAAAAFAWNCALSLTLAYSAQGLGIVTHLFKSWNMPRSLRVLIAAMALISLATPTAGIAVAVALPLIGVTEILDTLPKTQRSRSMRVILNQDVPNLGELGDVKDVAAGYARNFLFPRSLAFAHNAKSLTLFEKRKAEIDAIKASKRSASTNLKERIEAEEIVLVLPAGANGKLYGAVTGHNVADELLKKGIDIDRKRIEVPGRSIKSVGSYKIAIRLYEKDEATLRIAIQGQPVKSEAKEEAPKPRRRRSEERDSEGHGPTHAGAQAGDSGHAEGSPQA